MTGYGVDADGHQYQYTITERVADHAAWWRRCSLLAPATAGRLFAKGFAARTGAHCLNYTVCCRETPLLWWGRDATGQAFRAELAVLALALALWVRLSTTCPRVSLVLQWW